MSFSFKFYWHLSNKETTEVASLLSLLDECDSREEKRDVRVWEGFSRNSFFRVLLDLSPGSVSVFSEVWRIKIIKKSSSLNDRFC